MLVPIEPKYREFQGTRLQALRFVFSENVPRRHLTPSQAAVVAVEFETAETELMIAEQNAADDRKKAGNVKGGKTAGRGRPIARVNELTQPKRDNEGRVDAQLAAAHGTNRQYVADVRKIAVEAPEAVAGGEASGVDNCSNSDCRNS